MNKNIETMLHDEIKDEIEGLGKVQLGTDEYKTTVEGLTKLMDRAIEIKKFDADQAEKEANIDLRIDQMKQEKKDSWIENVLTAAGIIIPTGVTIWGTLKSLKFEETGTVTTVMGRGFINKLLPKK